MKMKKLKGLEDVIPLVPVPPEMWEEMLKRGGGDPKMARWIWSCWMWHEANVKHD